MWWMSLCLLASLALARPQEQASHRELGCVMTGWEVAPTIQWWVNALPRPSLRPGRSPPKQNPALIGDEPRLEHTDTFDGYGSDGADAWLAPGRSVWPSHQAGACPVVQMCYLPVEAGLTAGGWRGWIRRCVAAPPMGGALAMGIVLTIDVPDFFAAPLPVAVCRGTTGVGNDGVGWWFMSGRSAWRDQRADACPVVQMLYRPSEVGLAARGCWGWIRRRVAAPLAGGARAMGLRPWRRPCLSDAVSPTFDDLSTSELAAAAVIAAAPLAARCVPAGDAHRNTTGTIGRAVQIYPTTYGPRGWRQVVREPSALAMPQRTIALHHVRIAALVGSVGWCVDRPMGGAWPRRADTPAARCRPRGLRLYGLDSAASATPPWPVH